MAKKDKGVLTGEPVTYQISDPAAGVKLETFIPWTLVKRGVKREVITPLDSPVDFHVKTEKGHRGRKVEQHSPLLRALGLAHYWKSLLDEGLGLSPAAIAIAEGIGVTQVRRLLRLTLLAPQIIEWLIGKPTVMLELLMRNTCPSDWQEQEKLLCKKLEPS